MVSAEGCQVEVRTCEVGRVRRSGRATGVTMMEPADLWERDDIAHLWRFDWARYGAGR